MSEFINICILLLGGILGGVLKHFLEKDKESSKLCVNMLCGMFAPIFLFVPIFLILELSSKKFDLLTFMKEGGSIRLGLFAICTVAGYVGEPIIDRVGKWFIEQTDKILVKNKIGAKDNQIGAISGNKATISKGGNGEPLSIGSGLPTSPAPDNQGTEDKDMQQKILNALTKNKYMSLGDLKEHTGIEHAECERLLLGLADEGKVARHLYKESIVWSGQNNRFN